MTDAVAPVKLPENDNELGDAMFTGVVTGWKRRRFAQRNEPTPLMKFSVNIDPTVNCHFFLPDQAVCGQYFDGGYNACGAYPDVRIDNSIKKPSISNILNHYKQGEMLSTICHPIKKVTLNTTLFLPLISSSLLDAICVE